MRRFDGTLHSIWCAVVDDPAVPAHDIIPEAMRRVAQHCGVLVEAERASLPVETGNLPRYLAMAQVLTNAAKLIEDFRKSSY